MIAVVADQQRSVPCNRHAARLCPGAAVVNDEPGQEILVVVGRHAILQVDAHDLVAGAEAAVPRAVQRDERIAHVLGRKRGRALRGVVERDGRGRRVRREQHIRHGDPALEVRALSGHARILVVTEVVPGPAVELARAHARDVVGDEIIAQVVALVGRAPEVAAARVHGQAHAVAYAIGEVLAGARIGRVEHQHRGTTRLLVPGRAQAMFALPRPRFRPATSSSGPRQCCHSNRPRRRTACRPAQTRCRARSVRHPPATIARPPLHKDRWPSGRPTCTGSAPRDWFRPRTAMPGLAAG